MMITIPFRVLEAEPRHQPPQHERLLPLPPRLEDPLAEE